MPNQGKGRSNYRLDPRGGVLAKGYGFGRYSRVRVVWDSTQEGDLCCADVAFEDAPIAHNDLLALISGLNNGTIVDRW